MLSEATDGAEETASSTCVWIDVGRVVRPHGTDGCLGISLFGDDPANLLAAARVRLRRGSAEREFTLARAAPRGAVGSGRARVRLWLEGLRTRNDAELWAGASVEIEESALAPLPHGEYYWRELIGLACVTLAGRELGVIEEIWPAPENDLLVLRHAGETRLIPALRRVLVRIDREGGVLWIDPPPGLLEDAE